MTKTIATGWQDFGEIQANNLFWIDKTHFVKEWWQSNAQVTLITRPRRFGKTLTMSMVEHFFSPQYAGQREKLFGEYAIWQDPEFRAMQGTIPVLFLTFADVKGSTFHEACQDLNRLFRNVRSSIEPLLDGTALSTREQALLDAMEDKALDEKQLLDVSQDLCALLHKVYKKNVLVLLDEYDTPMTEAWLNGYWDEMSVFMKKFFNATFKTNRYLGRALMTGITRISQQSLFSDFNNPTVATIFSDKYATCFGFTQDEVDAALDEYGMGDRKADVKDWYDGYRIGNQHSIYNPWSFANFLDYKELQPYWMNTSSNALAGKFIQEGGVDRKVQFEKLLKGGTVVATINENIVFTDMENNPGFVYALLLQAGYFRVEGGTRPEYKLALTNKEVRDGFEMLVRQWFQRCGDGYNNFVKYMLRGDLESMNAYMNEITRAVLSSFDTANGDGSKAPENLYHGLVLGMMITMRPTHIVTSNHESGYGRYDVCIEPRDKTSGAHPILIEFKVFNPKKDADMDDCVRHALAQIEEKQYAADLIARGWPADSIRKYGFAFKGKEVLIGE